MRRKKNMHIYLTGFICYNTKRFAAVAQLDRVPDSDSGGRGFESRQPYHMKKGLKAFEMLLTPFYYNYYIYYNTTHYNTTHDAKAELENGIGLCVINWWRWGELNPRPKTHQNNFLRAQTVVLISLS